jgi:hypothetical protein
VIHQFLLPVAAIAAFCSSARAQSFNVDIGDFYGTPSNAYAAAAGQAGFWNSRSPNLLIANVYDLTGTSTSVMLVHGGTIAGHERNIDDPATSGDDQALMDDAEDVGDQNVSSYWSFVGLLPGPYLLYTYAWAPNSSSTRCTVTCGTIDPPQLVGGAWTGAHAQGVTYALHHLVVPGNGMIQVTIDSTPGIGSVNGFQLVLDTSTPSAPFCFGDGSGVACPCGNTGAIGHGCAHSINANGGLLGGSGNASIAADTFVLQGTNMPDSSALYFQGTTPIGAGTGAVFGDGLRCAGGSVVRLGTKTNSGGASQFPSAGDPPISVQGLNAPGNMRYYQVWFRNAAAFCTPSTFNLTNGVQVTWG